nr:PREDICTED: uncharacterized protein LOC107078462 [Lepisosteus oculatus]
MTSFPRLLVQSPISRDITIYQLRKMAQERGSKGFLAQEMTGKDRFLPELPQKGNRPTQNLKVLQVRRPIGLTWKQWKGTERAHLISMKGEFSETPQPVQSKKTPKFQKQREIILEDNLKDKLQERMDNLRGKDDTVKKEYLNEIFDSEKQEKSQKNDKDNRSVIKEDISTISADNIPSNFFGEMSTNSSSSTYLFKQLSDGEIKIIEDSLCGTITMVELNDLSESIVAWVVVSISRTLLPAISLYEERSRSLSQSSFQSQVHISTNEETLQATLSSHSLSRTGSHCSVQVQRKSSGFICGRSRTSTPFASPCSSLTSLENYAEEERGNDAPSHIKTGTPSPKLVDTEGREKIEEDSSEPLKKLFGIPNSTIIKNADCIVQDVIGRALIEIQHPAPQEEPWHSHVRSLIPSSRSSNLASKILDDVLECVNSALSTSIQQNSTKRPANGVPDHLETQEVESTDSQVARRILQLVSEKLEPCFTDTVEAVTQEEMESELGIVASEIINAVLEEIKTVKDRQRVSELTPDVPQNREMVTSIGSSVTRSSSFQLVPLKHIETVEEVFPKQETEAKCFLTCDINPRSFESPVGTKRVLRENVMGISESEINNTPKQLVKREVRPVAKCLADRHKSESRGRATLLVSQVMMRAAAKLKSFNPSDLLETSVSITGEAALLTALDMPKHSQRTVSLGSSSFYLEVNAAASGLVDAILEKLQRAAATEKHKDTKEACNSDFPPEFETAVSSRQVHSVNEDVFKTVMTKLKHFFSQDTLIAFSAAKRSPDKQDKLDGPLKHFPTLKRVLPQTNSSEPYSFKESHLMQKSVLPICPNASEHLGVLRDISSLRPILKSQDIQLMVKTCAQDIVCQLMQTIKSEMNRVETMRATLSEESLLASLQVDTIIIRIETVKVSELNLSLNTKESEKDRKADEEAVVRKKICSRQHVQTVNAPATVFPSHMGQVEYCSRNIPGQTPSSIFPKLPSRMSLVAKQGDTVASESRQLSQALVWKELSTSLDLIKESPSNGTLREPERARAASVEEGDHSLTSPTCATPAGTIQAAISLSNIDFIAMKIVDRIVTRFELLACAEDQCNHATNKDTSECDVTPTSKSRAHESVGRIHKVSHGLQDPGANVSLLQTGGPEERGCSNSSIAVAPTMNAAGKTLGGILTSSIPSLFSEELIDTVSKVISESSITKKSDSNPNSETADKNLKTSVFSIQFLILYAERSVRKLLELGLTFPGSQSRESEEHDVFGAPHVFNKTFYTVEQKDKESVTNSGHGLEKRNHSSQIHNDALDLLTRALVQFVIKVLFASYDLPLEPNNSDSEGIARSVSVESTQETLEEKVILDCDTKRFSKGNVPGSDNTAHSLHTEERKIDGKLTQTTRGRPLITYGVLPPIKERPRQGQPSSKDEPGQQTVGELQTEEGMSPGERPWNKKQEPPAKGNRGATLEPMRRPEAKPADVSLEQQVVEPVSSAGQNTKTTTSTVKSADSFVTVLSFETLYVLSMHLSKVYLRKIMF